MIGGTAQSLVWIEQWAYARKRFDGITGTARSGWCPGDLTFPLALLSEVELRRGKIAAAYAAAAEPAQLAAETA